MTITAAWRGISTDPETARYLTAVAAEVTRMTKAAGVPDFTVTPIPGCGSYQTSTTASAGTHAGGGAVDVNAEPLSDAQARILESAARKWGGTAWFRPRTSPTGFVYGWQRHVHILRTDCADLASPAVTQVAQYRRGLNGLANNGPDTGDRSWVAVTWGAVKSAADTVSSIGGAVVAASFNYADVSMDMRKGIDVSALRPGQSNAHIARLESAIWNWRGIAFRKALVSRYRLTSRAQLYSPAYTDMLAGMVGDSYRLLHQLEPKNGWLTARQARGVDPLPTWPGPVFLRRIGFRSVY